MYYIFFKKRKKNKMQMILKLHVKLRTIHNSRKKKKNVTTDAIPLNYTEKNNNFRKK